MTLLSRPEQADEPAGDEARRWIALVILFEAARDLRALVSSLSESR